jgi:hypothetical protein
MDSILEIDETSVPSNKFGTGVGYDLYILSINGW